MGQLRIVFSARPTMLERVIVKGHSVCVSVRLSVRPSHSWSTLTGSRYRNTFQTIR